MYSTDWIGLPYRAVNVSAEASAVSRAAGGLRFYLLARKLYDRRAILSPDILNRQLEGRDLPPPARFAIIESTMKTITRYRSACRFAYTLPALGLALIATGCGSNAPSAGNGASPPPPPGPDDNVPSATPLPKELAKPAAGKGNVQGKVLFNDKPAANIEVVLSEKFNQFLGGASGKTYTARTDKNGDYVIKNVPPKEYEGLTAKVFDTNMVIFIKSGIINARKYTVEANKTIFVDPTHLFKSDLKVTAPKAASTVKQAAFAWQAYPGAAYYKISIYADDIKSTSGVYGERVDGTSYKPAKPMQNGGYRVEVEAYNSNDRKLSEGPDGYKFRVG